MDKRQQAILEHVRRMAARADEHDAYNATVGDLNKQQLRWQTWRCWFYDQLQHEERRTGQARRALDQVDSSALSYNHQERVLTADQQQVVSAERLYKRALDLDSRIKAARREHNTEALTAVLTEAGQMIDDMAGYFPHAARPE